MKEEILDSKTDKETKKPFHIIGIGSSAGGLKALEEFFDHCPSDSGFAFVIVQHLSPDYKSLMPELLSRHTEMSVKEAKEEDEVMPNHVYLIPGSKNITVKDGFLKLTNRPPSSQMNFSIDIFFTSLAKEQKDMTMALILSGTGSDGTKGAKLIKEVGGTVFVQSPDSSKFDGMPRSAISNGLADYILDPRDMGRELVEFVLKPPPDAFIPSTGNSDKSDSLLRILKIIQSQHGYDFFSYKKATLLRRTAKRIHITKSKTVENYIDYLYDNPEEKFILAQEFLIGVTKFFRDTAAFDIFEKEVIPKIINTCVEKKKPIKIWTVACSTGEETYSTAILIEEYLRDNEINLEYKIFATDIDNRAVDSAAKGIFPENIATDVSDERLEKFFTRKDNSFQINQSIRKNIIFSRHDILQNPPFSKMDLVSCRNMLIYMENNIQLQVLTSIHYSLNMGGFLFLGSSENLGSLHKKFEDVSAKWKIYKNIEAESVMNISQNDMFRTDRGATFTSSKSSRNVKSIEDRLSKSINQILMDECKAVSVSVDENLEILHATGNLKKYIAFPEEGFSNNLLKILPDELNIPITTAIRRLSSGNDDVVQKSIKLIRDGELKEVRLVLRPLNIAPVNYNSYLILFFENEKNKEGTIIAESIDSSYLTNSSEIAELKDALNETKENLQATIEELETSNEEMQATNEELLASNEELQSTNEELQSLNEELHTVNAELQEKNLQLFELNSDVENLVKNINIGTIFLDREFNVRKFTPSISNHFQLRTEDIGRPISHFSGTLGGDDLVKFSKKVIKTLAPFKKEVKNNTGNWFLMQIFPYRNQEDMIRGVVINFIDIHHLKIAITEKDKLNGFLSHLTKSNPTIIYIRDIKSNKNTYESDSIWSYGGYNAEEIKRLGDQALETIVHPDDYPLLLEHRDKLENIKENELVQIEYRIIHRTSQKPVWIIVTEKLNERDKGGNVQSILGVAQPITKTKEMEQKLRQNEERFRLAIKGSNAGLWEWSNLEVDIAWWSPEFYKLLEFDPEKTKPSFTTLVNAIHPDQIVNFRSGLERHIETGEFFEEEIKIKTQESGYKWFRINAQAQLGSHNTTKKIVGTLININEKVKFKKVIEEKQTWVNAIYQNAPVGILLIDDQKHIKETSDGFLKILGFKSSEEVASLEEIIFEEDLEHLNEQFIQLSENKAPIVQLDVRCTDSRGEQVWNNIKITPLEANAAADNMLYCCTLIDINVRKTSEDKMKKLNIELERFAYLASHDLKEPLRTVTSFTKLFRDEYKAQLDDTANQYLDFIENASGRMLTLTNDLLVYSQLDDKSLNFQSININKLLSEILEDLQKNIVENNATITIDKLPNLVCDALQIRQLFQNLIANSLNYRKKDVEPKISIGFKNKNKDVEFFIKDNGIGIEEKYYQKIFDVFKRLHSQTEYEGTGIGLANCKRIVDNHNGKIWLTSKLGKGTTFYFTIPKK